VASYKKKNSDEDSSRNQSLVPLEKVSLMPEDYADANSALVRLGQTYAEKANASSLLLESGEKKEPERLTMEQVVYLNMLAAGLTPAEVCSCMKINRFQPTLWKEESEKDGVYRQCLKAIRVMEAENLEASVWRKASYDSLMAMYALKTRMPEYKDNYMPATGMETTINVNLIDNNGMARPYDTTANFKVVTSPELPESVE